MAPSKKPAMTKRQMARFEKCMPRAGNQIKDLQHETEKAELMSWAEDNRDLVPTLLFVCKSGMLLSMAADLRKEHWLPQSNVYFHNVSRAFFGYTVSQICPAATIDILQQLTHEDPDVIVKLMYLGTHTNRNTKVPTTHKISFVHLMKARHLKIGAPLDKLDWKQIENSGRVDFEKHGIFAAVRDAKKNITGLKINSTGEAYSFPRPCPARMELVDNWCMIDARLVDPEDEEDPVKLARRFKQLSKESHWVKEEIQEAEKTCNAEAVRIKKEEEEEAGAEEDQQGPAESSSTPSRKRYTQKMAQPVEPMPQLKRVKVEDETSIPAAPKVTPIKMQPTRKPKGCVK